VAVIKDDDGSVAGCHNSESAARRQMAALYAQEDMNKTMDQINVKAAVAVQTDEGLFEAVISTASVDREKDIVEPSAMVDALKKWNRPIPLAWNHSTDAKDIFGHIEPMTVREVGDEVVAQGQVDLESEMGREAWRSFKSRTVGFSFGYLILGSRERKGGGRHITGLDVFEITATPTPMNNDTRVLSTKNLEDEAQLLAREVVEDTVPALRADVAAEIEKAEQERKAAEETEEAEAPPPPMTDEQAQDLEQQTQALARAVAEDAVPALKETAPEGPDPLEQIKAAEAQVAALREQVETLQGFVLAQHDVTEIWTKAYVDALPDSAFLLVQEGDKDDQGRTTPRSKRHGPFKDADGNVNVPHLKDSLRRARHSNLPEADRGAIADKGKRVLEGQEKSAIRPDSEPEPLRRYADQLAEEVAGPRKKAPPPEPDPVNHDEVHRFWNEVARSL
jgi:HK97 family phage prohead protease